MQMKMKMELEIEKLKEDKEMENLTLELMMDASVMPSMQQEYSHQWQIEVLEK